jgi:selenocysteine lyase/cysteine desulfurase
LPPSFAPSPAGSPTPPPGSDNAGGSQVTQSVVDCISDYLLHTNVQLGADYAVSVESTRRVFEDGPRSAVQLFNASCADEIVFAASSTMNLQNLVRALEDDVQVGDEFIITGEHEGPQCIITGYMWRFILLLQQMAGPGRR